MSLIGLGWLGKGGLNERVNAWMNERTVGGVIAKGCRWWEWEWEWRWCWGGRNNYNWLLLCVCILLYVCALTRERENTRTLEEIRPQSERGVRTID